MGGGWVGVKRKGYYIQASISPPIYRAFFFRETGSGHPLKRSPFTINRGGGVVLWKAYFIKACISPPMYRAGLKHKTGAGPPLGRAPFTIYLGGSGEHSMGMVLYHLFSI